MCPISTDLWISSGSPVSSDVSPCGYLPQIEELGLEILARSDVPQVIVVLVCARDHVAAALQRQVGDDAHVLDADRTERAGIGAEPLADLLRMRRAEYPCRRSRRRTSSRSS